MKKITSVILAAVLIFGMCLLAFATDDIPEGYTPIYTAEDLHNIRNDLAGKYILMNDIDLSAYKNWESIGAESEPFVGILNGNGCKIVNLYSDGGIFDCLYNATIENLGVCDIQISRYINNIYAGVLANKAIRSDFKNCYSSGTVFGTTGNGQLALAYDFCAGGIAGYSELSRFENCYSSINISLEYTVMNFYAAGGITGQSRECEYVCCYAVSDFEEKFIGYGNTEGQRIYTGGLTGNSVSDNTFENCYFTDDSDFAVGLPAENPEITKSLSDDELKTQLSYEGFDFDNVWVMEENGYPVLNYEKINSNLDNSVPTLINAEIIRIPFEKRIVWGNSPDSPDGIEIQLKYSDSTFVIDTIVENENGYYANDEQIITPERGAKNDYGILNTGLYLNNGEIYVSYKYLALPTISELFNMVLGAIRTGGASV